MKTTVFLILMLLFAGDAQASFFGLVAPKCNMGDEYNAPEKSCYYCPRGSEHVDANCSGMPYLGGRCTHGIDHYFDSKSKRCVYCQRGYVLLFTDNKCHKKQKD